MGSKTEEELATRDRSQSRVTEDFRERVSSATKDYYHPSSLSYPHFVPVTEEWLKRVKSGFGTKSVTVYQNRWTADAPLTVMAATSVFDKTILSVVPRGKEKPGVGGRPNPHHWWRLPYSDFVR